jgi:N-acetylglucosamine malate deacetylase 2
VTLLAYPDGALATVPLEQLAADITNTDVAADALLTFDAGGITGHPDHQHATRAAVTAARRLDVPVWAWAIPARVATTLRREFDAAFVGRDDDEVDLTIPVDRTRQRRAIACHGSQLPDNLVPSRRIALQGGVETLRLLHDPDRPAPPPIAQEFVT